MKELKAKHALDVYEEYAKTGDDDAAQVYLKSEADKVIAELEKETDELQDKVIDLLLRDRNMALNFNNAVDALVHNKYKRCLAMAKVCKLKRYDAADYRIPRRKWDFYNKWLKRWLELAEKFKEAKL